MNKFLRRIYELDLINEEDQAPPPPGVEDVNDVTPVEIDTAQEVDTEVSTLSPESEVLLVRLLKKALVTEIDPDDVTIISDMNDINENNAKSSLSTLIRIMKSYSTDLDIEL
jgi:hypothetical protein